jgi:hypothetical protein
VHVEEATSARLASEVYSLFEDTILKENITAQHVVNNFLILLANKYTAITCEQNLPIRMSYNSYLSTHPQSALHRQAKSKKKYRMF